MSPSKVTMQTIAHKLNVSKVTVSKALNGRPGVSLELRKRILEVSREMGYQIPKTRQPSAEVTFGFVVPSRFFLETDKFYTKIYYHLSRRCATAGYALSLRILDAQEEEQLLPPFPSTNPVSALFIAGELHEPYLHSLRDLAPMVALDFCEPHLAMDAVVIDNFYASYSATLYLARHGHQNIGFVGDPSYSASVADRYYGYLKAMAECGLPTSSDWCISVNDATGVYFADVPLPTVEPTAWVCHCDMAAYHMLLILQKHGQRIPEDVSLIGFDNTELSQKTMPPLTTVDINTHELADAAYDRMLWRLAHPTWPHQRIVLSTRIIERHSVAAVRAELSVSAALTP